MYMAYDTYILNTTKKNDFFTYFLNPNMKQLNLDFNLKKNHEFGTLNWAQFRFKTQAITPNWPIDLNFIQEL